ncbi:MAG: TetR/AcrR family transcriptional regulator [Clostridia bacterium]|nr:TetR/AcrR family transcriptional regulator [Clostridia bacterium]
MAKKTTSGTKSKIITAAWKLFYEQGYDDTTIEDIVAASGTSKGSFYHYFEGKDALLSSLSYLFDEEYEKLTPVLTDSMTAKEKLLFLNRQLFSMIENSISLELLAKMYSTQLVTKGERHLLDHNRTYYKLLRKIVSEGQKKGELNPAYSANDVVKTYALLERALLYDWCVCNGEYSLSQYAGNLLPRLMADYFI